MKKIQKKRPQRIQVVDHFGHRKSLPENPEQYQFLRRMTDNPAVLVLGVGPSPDMIQDLVRGYHDIAYLESPAMLDQMPLEWRTTLPGHWQKISTAALTRPDLLSRDILLYRPGPALFPDFWAPVLARVALGAIGPNDPQQQNSVWLPSAQGRLLIRELTQAFSALGLNVRLVPADISPTVLARLLRSERPDLFFSVNFQGLDPLGQNHELLRWAGAQVGVWCVDNPFHLLSGVRSEYWKNCLLFVTDAWFIPHLQNLGASQIFHLPLAAAQHFLQTEAESAAREMDSWKGLRDRIVFVGRTAFPGKNRFFAGCAIPESLERAATAFIGQGGRPDFSWWHRQLHAPMLWPGRKVRAVGFAAEQFSQRHRTLQLQAACSTGRLTVFGNPDWRRLLPELGEVRPEVDYYGPLAWIYRHAGCTLNLTSFLLPHGLTQRHFDVWAARGLLLTDATPGLNVFDQELVHEIVFNTPRALLACLRRLETDSALGNHLRQAWQTHIKQEHLYSHRIAAVLTAVALNSSTTLASG